MLSFMVTRCSELSAELGGQSKYEVGEGCGNAGQADDSVVLCFFLLMKLNFFPDCLHIIN